MVSSEDGRYVILKSGFALPIAACLLALELEGRGFTLAREDGDVLSVQPYQRLTREDCAAIADGSGICSASSTTYHRWCSDAPHSWAGQSRL